MRLCTALNLPGHAQPLRRIDTVAVRTPEFMAHTTADGEAIRDRLAVNYCGGPLSP